MSARATAKPVFAQVAAETGVDANILAHLFSRCMVAVQTEVLLSGSCTVRCLGRFDESQGESLVFTPKATPPTHAPFAIQQLRQRWDKGSS